METFVEQTLQIAGLGVWAMVTGKPLKRPLETVEDLRWEQKSGLFVTLYKGNSVRGSVGVLEAQGGLQETLFDVAGQAATHDGRYPPVEEDELDALKLEVTLLTEFKTICGIEDVIPGKTGLIISRGEHRAVLLPQVPIERNWTAEQFLEATCEKAGLSHKAWKDANTLVEIFNAQNYSGHLKTLIADFI